MKPCIGISACLLGHTTRYDGANRRSSVLCDEVGDAVTWVPICPEVESGLGIPREPMQLIGTPENCRLIALRTKADHTDRLLDWARNTLGGLSDIHGFVFKARSPSCGVRDAEILPTQGADPVRGSGLFAREFRKRFPHLPVEDEQGLEDPRVRVEFLNRAARIAGSGDGR
jgi:uncharacterized protein YbbK (DUF523 family)